MAPSRGDGGINATSRPSLHLARIVAACWIFSVVQSARPESDLQVKQLSVDVGHFTEFHGRGQSEAHHQPKQEAPDNHEDPKTEEDASTPGKAADTPVLPNTDAEACQKHYLTPSNWGLSLHLGREAKGGLAEAASEKGAPLKITEIANAFRDLPAVVQSCQYNVYLRPYVDAWTPHWIFSKFGCKFEGEVRLSLTEDCQESPSSVMKSVLGKDGESVAFRVSAPRRLLVAAKSRQGNATENPMLNQASDIQLYFCVKPAKNWEWKALTLLWYFRDADGKSALALNAEESRMTHLMRGWSLESGLEFKDPRADEKDVPTCSKTRWKKFAELEQELKQRDKVVMDSEAKVNPEDYDDKAQELQKAGAEAIAGTPCEERNAKGMQPHSAIVLQLVRSNRDGQSQDVEAAKVVAGGISEHPASPGTKSLGEVKA